MKAAFFLGLFLMATLPLRAADSADTAYSALRVVGKRQGQEVLNRVVELRGRSGSPQPAIWKVVLDEPQARGGVREVEVQKGKIVGERTPTGKGLGSPMNFNQLNLDSEGAFTVANKEAQKAGLPFDRVDYVLKSGTGGGAPVWELELFDGPARSGTLTIAADSGTVLHRQLDRSSRSTADQDRAFLADGRNAPPDSRPNDRPDDRRDYRDDRSDGHRDDSGDRSEGRYSRSGEPFRSVPDFFHRLGRRFQKRGHQLENFFTGKGSWHDDEER